MRYFTTGIKRRQVLNARGAEISTKIITSGLLGWPSTACYLVCGNAVPCRESALQRGEQSLVR